MKKSNQLLLGIGVIAAVGLMVYVVRRHRSNIRQRKVASEGYETAHDILFPQKKNRGRRLQYGPVLPE